MLFKGDPLPGASAGKKYSCVISLHIGQKLKTCGNSFIKLKYAAYTHLSNGKPIQGQIVHGPCPASCYIFVPLDSTFHHLAIVVPDHVEPHNHLMLPMTKVSYEAKDTYCKCISANGIMASTTKKVNTCMFLYLSCHSIALICFEVASSKLLLNRWTPGEAFPVLIK